MTDSSGHHEGLGRTSAVKQGSDRSFGIVFSIVFVIVALWPLWDGGAPHIWAFIVAAVFLGAALAWPRLLGPLNRLWLAFGALLHRIVSPIFMAVLFYVTITPMGLIMRMLGKRPIPMDFDKTKDSYWIEREPPGPAPDTMKNQF